MHLFYFSFNRIYSSPSSYFFQLYLNISSFISTNSCKVCIELCMQSINIFLLIISVCVCVYIYIYIYIYSCFTFRQAVLYYKNDCGYN